MSATNHYHYYHVVNVLVWLPVSRYERQPINDQLTLIFSIAKTAATKKVHTKKVAKKAAPKRVKKTAAKKGTKKAGKKAAKKAAPAKWLHFE